MPDSPLPRALAFCGCLFARASQKSQLEGLQAGIPGRYLLSNHGRYIFIRFIRSIFNKLFENFEKRIYSRKLKYSSFLGNFTLKIMRKHENREIQDGGSKMVDQKLCRLVQQDEGFFSM